MSKCNCVCSPVCCCPVDSVECKQALKLVEEKFTSTNSDYAAALRVHAEWLESHSNFSFPSFCKGMAERLHSSTNVA